MKISWATYKVVFIGFFVVYGTFQILESTGTLDPEPPFAVRATLVFLCDQILLFGLFCFLLYAKIKGVADCHKLFTPSRWLPLVTFLVAFSFVIHFVPFLQIAYVLQSTTAEYRPVLESKLEQMKKDALDKGVPIEKRREKADRYHIETNEKILFLDETGKRRFLAPTAASKAYDKEFKDVQNSVDVLYRFLLLPGLASFLLAGTATFLYFRYR